MTLAYARLDPAAFGPLGDYLVPSDYNGQGITPLSIAYLKNGNGNRRWKTPADLCREMAMPLHTHRIGGRRLVVRVTPEARLGS